MNQPIKSDQLVTIRDLLRFGESQFNQHSIFFGHGTDNAYDEALLIILHTLHLPYNKLSDLLDTPLKTSEKELILSLFHQRITARKPAAYLINQAWFCNLSFYINENVLVPRSPIAELIKVNFKPYYLNDEPVSILDLCTGSGCIGIACAYAYKNANILLSDLSKEALIVADKNINDHKLLGRVKTIQSDLFEHIQGHFDIIVTNPPYVDEKDFSDMPEEFRHEPSMALASGQYGLDHPLKILKEASSFLTDDGILVMEVGNSGAYLADCYPEIDFNWVTFEQGGHGVFVMSKYELENYQSFFN